MSSGPSTRFQIIVMPREVILDTQGRAVEDSLKLQGLSIKSCRVGKHIELEIPGDEASALKIAQKIASQTLHNPLLETFTVKVI